MVPIRLSDGSVRKIPLSFKDFYKDEYTAETLPHGHICHAMADEIQYLMEKVLTVVPYSEAMADKEGKLVGGR